MSMNNKEPQPTTNNQPAAWDLVFGDMKERDQIGTEKYGTRLQPHNGRDFLVDAYQEVLDLAVYLRGRIEEERWFPSSVLPEIDPVGYTSDYVLGCWANNSMMVVYFDSTYMNAMPWIDAEGGEACVTAPTHWRKLPAPPKPEEK